MQFEETENKDGFYATWTVAGTSAATAGNYPIFFTARFPCEVLRVTERHETAGSDAGAVTLDVMKVPDATAIASGSSVLASTFNLKSTANTLVSKQGVNLSANRQLKENQSLALLTSGTLTALVGVHVTVYLKYLGRGSYR